MNDALISGGLFIIIVGPLIGLVCMLVGLIRVFTPASRDKGRKNLLYGVLIIIVSVLIGLAMCSGADLSFR